MPFVMSHAVTSTDVVVTLILNLALQATLCSQMFRLLSSSARLRRPSSSSGCVRRACGCGAWHSTPTTHHPLRCSAITPRW